MATNAAPEENPYHPPERTPRRRLSLRATFVLASLLAFVLSLLFVQTAVLAPSGAAVWHVPLWQAYVIGLPRVFSPVSVVGPGSGLGPILVMQFLLHIAGCCLVGGFATGLRWGWQRLRGPAA